MPRINSSLQLSNKEYGRVLHHISMEHDISITEAKRVFATMQDYEQEGLVQQVLSKQKAINNRSVDHQLTALLMRIRKRTKFRPEFLRSSNHVPFLKIGSLCVIYYYAKAEVFKVFSGKGRPVTEGAENKVLAYLAGQKKA